MKTIRALLVVLSFSASVTVPAMAGLNVVSPATGDQVSSPFKLSAWATSCASDSVTAMGYSFDSSSDTTIVDGQSIDTSINAPSGHHILHVKAWSNGNTCVEDLDINVGNAGSAAPGSFDTSIIPPNAISVSHLDTMSSWRAHHDHGASGSASGSTKVVSSPSISGNAWEFQTEFSDSGDERYSLSFSDDTSAQNFFYDAWVYVDSSASHIGNLEFDINQTMSNGKTVMFGIVCDGYTQHWAYTANTGSDSNPRPRHISENGTYCNPRAWPQNTWHHLQAYYSHDHSGYITYHSVWLDGIESKMGQTVFGKYDLGWGPVINTQFQVDGLGSNHNTVYLANLSIQRW